MRARLRRRARLALTTVAVVMPVAAALVWFQATTRRAAPEDELAEIARVQMHSGGRERCEASPETWMAEAGRTVRRRRPGPRPPGPPPPPPPRGGGPPPGAPGGPPTETYAYDRLVSRNPRSPSIDGGLAAGRARRVEGPAAPRLEVLVPMPWTDGPCAVVLIRRELPREPSVIPEMGLWLAPVAVTLPALLVAVGPIVSRLRRLREQVRRSARAGYADTISLPGRDVIAELAVAFDDAGRAIRGREEALRSFLANTTHDVMISLTVLLGHLAELARAEDAPPAVTAAMNEAHHLASLIHNLAVAAKLEAGEPEVHREPVDLGVLVERGGTAPADRAAARGRPARGSRRRRARTCRRRPLSSRPRRRRPGIPAEDRSRLRERGARGDAARTREPTGQGLGLHMLHRLTVDFVRAVPDDFAEPLRRAGRLRHAAELALVVGVVKPVRDG